MSVFRNRILRFLTALCFIMIVMTIHDYRMKSVIARVKRIENDAIVHGQGEQTDPDSLQSFRTQKNELTTNKIEETRNDISRSQTSSTDPADHPLYNAPSSVNSFSDLEVDKGIENLKTVANVSEITTTEVRLPEDKTLSVSAEDSEGTSNSDNTSGDISKKKRIVIYHFYHTMLRWQTKAVDLSKCYNNVNCEIIFQGKCSSEPIDADAVVFQGNNIAKDRPTRLNPDQVFVYLNAESPQYLQQIKLGSDFFSTFFNWTMTYRPDSDIPYLYGSVIPNFISKEKLKEQIETTTKLENFRKYQTYENEVYDNHAGIEGKNYEAIFRNKTHSAVWFDSHCKTASKRELYVMRMQEYTHIDINGKCYKDKVNVCPKTNNTCDMEIEERYKFFLAFENSVCNDYITEKVFRWFTKDIVLVVRGARNYKHHLPKGTYIDADDFSSPTKLAKYLTFLSHNEAEYIKYLKRKDHYTIITEQEHVQLAYCNLCHRLHNLERYRKPAASISKWWLDQQCIHANDIYKP